MSPLPLADLDLFMLRTLPVGLSGRFLWAFNRLLLPSDYPVDCRVSSIRSSLKIALKDTPFGMATLLTRLMSSSIYM
jgi:hypothetical protein